MKAKLTMLSLICGLWTVAFFTWCYANAPVPLTAEQEASYVATEEEGFGCLTLSTGCTKKDKPFGRNTTQRKAPACNQTNGGLCSGVSWSSDDTKDQACLTMKNPPTGTCTAGTNHSCKKTFAVCWNGSCSNERTMNGGYATTCSMKK